uniref:Potassium calcium-activated channel subfamily M regulatory beta subunit 4 n=1 Tax=Pavo cristatus TaxID=9049 RepID=A0A8C9G487_PAVCR
MKEGQLSRLRCCPVSCSPLFSADSTLCAGPGREQTKSRSHGACTSWPTGSQAAQQKGVVGNRGWSSPSGAWILWQCSYIPPCARDDQENSENVTYKQKYWKEKVGSQPFTCYFNDHLRPDDVMLKLTHDETVLLHCFLWPLVTFLVGVLIVALTACARSLAARAEAIQRKKHL